MEEFLKTWQELLGSIIGAMTPIIFLLLVKFYESNTQKKENLLYLEKILVHQINNLIDIRRTIEEFLNTKLTKLISYIEESTKNNSYSNDYTFYPQFYTNSLQENILKINSGSGYLDNKFNQLIMMSKDFNLGIEDSKRQFDKTLEIQKDMTNNKCNSPIVQNNTYKNNIKEFQTIMFDNIINKNVEIYLKKLIEAKTVTEIIRTKGFVFWKLKFKYNTTFKYFKNKKNYRKYKEEVYNRIDSYIELKVKNELEKIKKLI